MSGLTVPGGIADDSTRVLVQLIDERFGGVGVEKVLVWHLDSTVESAIPHVAEMIGLDGPEFQGGTPRELLRRGIVLRRRRGTPWALREVLRRLGYGEIEIIEVLSSRHDGEYLYDGARMYGGDEQPGIFWLEVKIAESKSAAWVRALWDVIDAWKRKSFWQVLILRRAADDLELARFHTREECDAVEIG